MSLDLPPSWPVGYPLHRPLSTEESRALDRRAESEFGIPSLVLMEHASCGVAALAAHLAGAQGRILVLCGPGNNGGDGYGAARFLRSWDLPVEVLRAAPREPRGGDAGAEYRLAAGALPIGEAWSRPEIVGETLERGPAVVVDALFGVGLTRPLEEPFLGWIRALNEAPVLRLAVDVPSGMESDSGRPLPACVQAHATATMAAPKHGLRSNAAAAGVVVEVDIGLPRALHEPFRA